MANRKPSLPERVDLLVVGAGTAGAALAGRAAAGGLSVLCLDRGALDGAGARWVNGVATEAFVDAGVPLPTGDELRGSDAGFHMVAGWGPERMVMRGHGVLEVDMRRLVARLQDRGEEAGATFVGDVEVRAVEGTEVRTSAGVVRAQTVVDASGLAGIRLLDSPPTPPGDICAAAQAVFAVDDPAGAAAFLDEHEVAEGETLCFTGVAGGYSILNVSVHGDEVSLLTGSIPADGHPSGRALLERFVAEQFWIGTRRFGGHRAIPLGRPHDVIAAGDHALLGDAARQVFSAHGSGIGAGMVAAGILADALIDGTGPEAYAVTWMRRYGGLFAAYDSFRRFSQGLGLEELRRLFRAGVLDPETAAAGLGQRLPTPDVASALGTLRGLARVGAVAAPLTAAGARMAALMPLYAAYPRSAVARRRWARAVGVIHGGPP